MVALLWTLSTVVASCVTALVTDAVSRHHRNP